jgi:hypothetical protein
MYQTKVVEGTKTHVLCSRFIFRNSGRLWNDVKKYGRGRQISGGNIKQRMRFACRFTKTADTLSKYVILIAFPRQQWWRERVSMLLFYGNRQYGWDWWTIVIILACFSDEEILLFIFVTLAVLMLLQLRKITKILSHCGRIIWTVILD